MPPVYTGKRTLLEQSRGVMSGPEWWRLYDAAGSPAKLDARSVPCRVCGARAGVYCRRPSGHKAQDAHALRWDDAVRAIQPAALEELEPAALPLDVEYADEEETGQLALGVPGEQRSLPGLAAEGKPAPVAPDNKEDR